MNRIARRAAKTLAVLAALAALVLGAWSAAIGPRAVWRVLAHGTTTVRDHLEYPGRQLRASPRPRPWPAGTPAGAAGELTVEVDGREAPLDSLLEANRTLALAAIVDGELVHEWYAPGHGPGTPSMIFSVTKSVLSLMIGAAVDDGVMGSAADPVTEYLPELADPRFEGVTLRDLLRMDSSVDYEESDNPFGAHVEFNYTADLTADVLGLGVRDRPDSTFRYKSADYALLGLALDRALGERSLTGYLQERFWDPLGAETGGAWSTDREGGLERTWCCLAVTARDLARLGQLVLSGGSWHGERLLPERWIRESLEPAYRDRRWTGRYRDSPLADYGYGWWLTGGGAAVALGKDGQYVYVDPARNAVVVRLGEGRGEVAWVSLLERVAEAVEGPERVAAPAAVQGDTGRVDAGGASLFYRDLGSGGAPVIVLHGGPSPGHGYLLPWMARLAADRRVILFDQRGTGRSDVHPDSQSLTRSLLVGDVTRLRQALGLAGPVHLVGHSWGGLLAIEYALGDPAAVRSLVLVSTTEPGSRYRGAVETALRDRRSRSDSVELAELFASPGFRRGDVRVIERIYQLNYRPWLGRPGVASELSFRLDGETARKGRRTARLLVANSPPPAHWSDLPELEVPALVVHGDRDPVPVAMARALADSLPAGRIEALHGVGHFPFAEAPDEFFRIVRDFLDDHAEEAEGTVSRSRVFPG